MSNYHRANVPGGTFFFTIALANRKSTLLTDSVELLRASFAATRRTLPFRMEAVVVLPNHLHCIWRLPAGDSDFSSRWTLIKTYFSRRIAASECVSASRVSRRERGIWQRRFWEHAIRDDADFTAHLDYIHYNPVKHGHAQTAANWPYSSFRRYVKDGVYTLDWAVETRDVRSSVEL